LWPLVLWVVREVIGKDRTTTGYPVDADIIYFDLLALVE